MYNPGGSQEVHTQHILAACHPAAADAADRCTVVYSSHRQQVKQCWSKNTNILG
jgi:hypothetical protein